MLGRLYGKCSQVAEAWAGCNWLQRLISRYRSREGGGLYKYKYTVLCLKVVFMKSYIPRLKRPISSQVPQPTPTKCLKSGGEVNGLMASEFLIMPCQKNPWAAGSNEDYEEPRKIWRCSALFCWGVNLGLLSPPHTLVHRLTDCIDLARFLEGGFEGDCQCVTLYAVYLVFV